MCEERRKVFAPRAHGWLAAAWKKRCQVGRKQATSLSPITPANLPMSWQSKFINPSPLPLITKLFFCQKEMLAPLETGTVKELIYFYLIFLIVIFQARLYSIRHSIQESDDKNTI